MSTTFLLLVHASPDGWDALDEDEAHTATQDRAAAIEALRESGRLIACSPLADPREAREVRVREGRMSVTAETVVAWPVAGFYLVVADDLGHAERLAATIPDADTAHMTVRELLPLPGIPAAVPPALAGTDAG